MPMYIIMNHIIISDIITPCYIHPLEFWIIIMPRSKKITTRKHFLDQNIILPSGYSYSGGPGCKSISNE